MSDFTDPALQPAYVVCFDLIAKRRDQEYTMNKREERTPVARGGSAEPHEQQTKRHLVGLHARSVRPCIRVGAPQAKSTMSIPRRTSGARLAYRPSAAR